MPLPVPKKSESKDDFISRCMGNETMKDEYPDNDQRLAVCYSQWKKKEKKDEFSELEERSFDFQIEKRDDETGELIGHAAIFNKYTDILWWKERIIPGAFKESIKSDDIRALFNHDPNYVLGRNKAGTLKLEEDEKGLAVRIKPPDTQIANDVVKLIERGDVSQMSFAFQVLEDAWVYGEEKDPDKRDLIKVKLWDVSPVVYPAYKGTDIAVRSYENWKKLHTQPETAWRRNLLRRYFNIKIKGG